jgi:hypothetical protein
MCLMMDMIGYSEVTNEQTYCFTRNSNKDLIFQKVSLIQSPKFIGDMINDIETSSVISF